MSTQLIIDEFKRVNWITERQAEGLTHADSLLQPPFRGNCFNWILGHMLVGRNNTLKHLGREPYCDEETVALYKFDSEPITDGEKARPLADLLAGMSATADIIVAELEKASDDFMDEIIDEERGQTRRQAIDFLAWHESYHVGQLELLRQLAGIDDKVI